MEKEELIHDLWVNGQAKGKIKTHSQLARKIGLSQGRIYKILEAREFRNKENIPGIITTKIIAQTAPLADRHRKQVLNKVRDKEIDTLKYYFIKEFFNDDKM